MLIEDRRYGRSACRDGDRALYFLKVGVTGEVMDGICLETLRLVGRA